MLGLMQDWQLLCHRILDHAAIYHGERQVITRSVEGPIHTTNYADLRERALRVAQRLERTASSSATAWRRWPGIPGGTSKPGTASWASARSITPSIRACFPIRSPGSSITPKTA